jgi:hypothetical protein
MSDIEHVRSELVRIFGSEVADNPRVVAAALQAESLDRGNAPEPRARSNRSRSD